ncbi:MAG TPA: hypothetical protein VMF58_09705 [Rhizomicrobium sp.]|nr:hypothetical protein [Rhizomicrobium sp.]
MSKSYRLCIIGNSHVAALKMAWSKTAFDVRDDFALSFFAVQKYMFRHIGLKDRALVPTQDDVAAELQFRSDGLDRVDIERYDAIAMVGSGFGVDMSYFRSLGGTPDYLGFTHVDPLVSEACFDAVLDNAFEDSPAITLIDLIRSVSEIPIVMFPTPYLSERVLESEVGKRDFHLADRTALARCVARARAAGERIAAKRNCTVIWQDDATVGVPGFTSSTFNRGSVLFNVPDGNPMRYDDRHGNEEFGRLAMNQVLGYLDAISGGRVLAKGPERRESRSG